MIFIKEFLFCLCLNAICFKHRPLLTQNRNTKCDLEVVSFLMHYVLLSCRQEILLKNGTTFLRYDLSGYSAFFCSLSLICIQCSWKQMKLVSLHSLLHIFPFLFLISIYFRALPDVCILPNNNRKQHPPCPPCLDFHGDQDLYQTVHRVKRQPV